MLQQQGTRCHFLVLPVALRLVFTNKFSNFRTGRTTRTRYLA